jgi:hypothetical protein
LCLFLALFLVPIAGADTVQKISVSGKPLSPVVDTSNGDVYVPSTGPGSDRAPGNVSVISGTSLVGTVAMTFQKPGSSCAPILDLKPATYDPGNGYVYVPSASGNCSGLGAISSMSVAGYANVLPIAADRATYDPNNGYIYVPVGMQVNQVCAARCTVGETTGPLYTYTYYGEISVVQGLTTVYNITIGLNTGVGAYNSSENPDVRAAFDPANGYVYAPDDTHDAIYVISGTSLVTTLSVGNKPGVPVVDTSTGDVYVPLKGSGIAVISGSTVTGTISTGSEAPDLVYDSGDGYMYAAGPSDVYVLSGTSIVATIAMTPGGYPAYDPDNGYVYVSDASAGTVVAISGTSIAYTDTVGGIPEDVVFDPVNGYLYVSDSHNGAIDVIIPLSGLVSPTASTTSCSSSSSVTKSSTTSSTTTVSIFCCQSTSSTSKSTTTSSSTSSTCSSSSTGSPVLINSTSSINSTSTEQSRTGTAATNTTSSSTTSSSGIGLGTEEIAVAVVAAIAAAGAGIWYFTQGDGPGGPSDGDGESPPSGCGPESAPSCGPVSPTVGRATRLVCIPCGASIEHVSGPSACSDPLTGHATRVVCTPCRPLDVVCGPTAGSNPLTGRATRVVCTPSSSSLDVVSGPSTCSNPLTAHATREVCTPKVCGPLEVTSGPSVSSPCSAPSSECSSAPTGEAVRTPVGCGPLARASCAPVGPCGEGHATRVVCMPKCQQVAQVKQVNQVVTCTQAHSCVRLSCAEANSLPQCQSFSVVKQGSLTGHATRQVCTPCGSTVPILKQPGPCGESSASARLACAETSSAPPGTVQQVHPPGQVTGRAVKAPCSVPQGQVKVVKQSKTQPSCCSGSNASQDTCGSSADDAPQCVAAGIEDDPEA